MDHGSRFALARRTAAVVAACLALAVLVSASAARAQGTAYLVRDVDERPAGTAVAVRSIVAVGERVFFAGNDGVHGFELWTSDGSEEGTRLVEDIRPGPAGDVITELTAVGDVVFFVVDDGEHGRELWTSDGTANGTHLVRDVAPGAAASSPRRLRAFDDLLFFVASDGVHGAELWLTDGSEAGTTMVADVRDGAAGARITDVVVAGGRVWFVANDGVHGSELWSSDGTAEGTSLVADLRPGADGSVPEGLVAFGDGVLFSADDGATGREPWRADALSGAVRVADVRPGVGGSRPADLVAAGELAFFTAAESDLDGARLWATDGTDAGTYRVGDLKGGYGPGSDVRLGPTAVIGDTLYFVTAVDDGRGAALWRTDGTDDGTELVKDLKPYPCSGEFGAMAAVGDRLMLVARSPESDDELWISDGTAPGTWMVKDIFPGYTGSRPGSLTVAGDVLFFAAYDGLHGRELWKSDGTEQGTVLVRDILGAGTLDGVLDYPPLMAQGSNVLFAATDYTIWTSDGTFDGTSPLGRTAGLAARWAWETGGAAAVEAFDVAGAGDGGLWRYDGTTFEKAVEYGPVAPRVTAVRELGGALYYTTHVPSRNGGQLLRSVPGTTTPLLLRSFSSWYPFPGGRRVRDRLYFSAGDHATGSELWVTDGTVAGTVLVKDVAPGSRSAVFNGGVLGNLGRRVLFAADDGVHGSELWRTDGTPAGTRLVRDIQPGPDWSGPYGGGRLGGALLFAARDASGTELWRSDGTESGTYRVKDIAPGPEYSSSPSGFVRLGDVLLFAASHPDTGLELWRTDGTESGTWLVADVQPGAGGDGIHPITVVGDVAYFRVETPNHAFELWVTDGTAAGTRRAADVWSGGPGGGVKSLGNRSGQLFLVANDGVHGNELWALTCGNGVPDQLEQCDQGDRNGSPAGCCTGVCTIRPGMEEACDPIEGSLEVRRARVQYDAPGGAASGRVTADGRLDADPALPLTLDAGLVAFVEDRAGFSARTDWSPVECAAQANGVLRCARPGAVATFRPVPGGATGATRYRFALNVGGLDVAGPLGPSLSVKLRTGDRLDRAGVIEDCVARRGALVCRP